MAEIVGADRGRYRNVCPPEAEKTDAPNARWSDHGLRVLDAIYAAYQECEPQPRPRP